MVLLIFCVQIFSERVANMSEGPGKVFQVHLMTESSHGIYQLMLCPVSVNDAVQRETLDL